MSYSLYLAHWPVIVFYRYWSNAPHLLVDQLLTLALSFAIGFFMYRYIELPFRRSRTHARDMGSVRIGLVLGSIASLILVSAGHALTHDGWTWRPAASYALTAREIAEQKKRRFVLFQKICAERGWDYCDVLSNNRTNVLILGDSHGVDGLNILANAFPDEHYVLKSLAGCPVLVPADAANILPNGPERNACIAANADRLDSTYLQKFDYVVISGMFAGYGPQHLAAAIDIIHAAGIHNIIVFGNFIILHDDMANILARGLDPRREPQLVHSFALYEDELSDLAARMGIKFVSKARYLCSSDELESCPIRVGDGLVIYDEHHLSYQAAEMLGHELAAEFGSLEALFELP